VIAKLCFTFFFFFVTPSHVISNFFGLAKTEFDFEWRQVELESNWVGSEAMTSGNSDMRKRAVLAFEMWRRS
jgi:hypothetical protein